MHIHRNLGRTFPRNTNISDFLWEKRLWMSWPWIESKYGACQQPSLIGIREDGLIYIMQQGVYRTLCIQHGVQGVHDISNRVFHGSYLYQTVFPLGSCIYLEGCSRGSFLYPKGILGSCMYLIGCLRGSYIQQGVHGCIQQGNTS